MKSCPKCNRTFPDEGQKFCTFDGGLLIAPQTFDPNATMRATSIDLNAPSEMPTSRDLPDPNATIIESYPATVALPRNTGPTGTPSTGDIRRPPPPVPPPPQAPVEQQPIAQPPPPLAPAEQQPFAQPPPPPQAPAEQQTFAPAVPAPPPPHVVQAPATSAPLPPVAKQKSKLPWIIVGVLLILLIGGGVLAGAFFFVIKPRLDQIAADRNANENRPAEQTTNDTTPPTKPVEEPASTPDSFVAPPNTVEFTNSNMKLDGTLAEHYFDFSFYYPKSWRLDPKSGVRGAINFVKVERSLPPDFTQENFVVGWYTSSGTFVGDLPTYPERVEEFSTALSKIFPEYRKVSEGLTKINSMQGYEFRWEGFSKGTEKGDLHLWGRVVFLPTGTEGDTSGATLAMLCTSLAPELSSVADVGEKGEAPVILESFRFGKKK